MWAPVLYNFVIGYKDLVEIHRLKAGEPLNDGCENNIWIIK